MCRIKKGKVEPIVIGKAHLKASNYTCPVVMVRYDMRRSKEVQMNINSFTFL